MSKRIQRSELKVGMFVIKYGRGTNEQPLVRVDKPLLTQQSIDDLIPADAVDIVVDPSVNLSVLGRKRAQEAPSESNTTYVAALSEELPIAEKLYSEALVQVHSFMDDVRRGKEIDYREATPVVDSFIESVFRNEAAAATLFKLRRFDEYSFTHSINVGVLAVILGKHLRMDRATLQQLGLAGMFHDVGKARIPEEVLNKPGKLSEPEFNIMKSHTLEGYRVMENQKDISPDILRAVVEHHERYDGTGYPRGLSGVGIGRFSRIISVVDVYDALTSKRVYKDAMAPAKALSLMYQWRERDFPPYSVEHFIKCMGVYPLGSFVRMTSGEYGIVASANAIKPTRPMIKIVFDTEMQPKPAVFVDLADPEQSTGLDIETCLNPADYNVELDRFLFTV